MNEHDPDRIVIQLANEFTMFNTQNVEKGSNPYVLPNQCEHVFYSVVSGRAGCSYVVRWYPRGREIKYIVSK